MKTFQEFLNEAKSLSIMRNKKELSKSEYDEIVNNLSGSKEVVDYLTPDGMPISKGDKSKTVGFERIHKYDSKSGVIIIRDVKTKKERYYKA